METFTRKIGICKTTSVELPYEFAFSRLSDGPFFLPLATQYIRNGSFTFFIFG